MTKEEKYLQNMHDLNRIIIIQHEIISQVFLTPEELEKLKYAEKLLKTVVEKQNHINKTA